MGRKKSDKPEPKALSIRLSDELSQWLSEKAKREHRSLNAQIAIELERAKQLDQPQPSH